MLLAVAALLTQPFAPPVLGGYLPSWRMGGYDLQRLAPLTDVMYFSIKPTAEGGLDLRDIEMEHLPELVKAKKRLGFRLILCCGGWERSEGFMPTASDPQRRARFVKETDAFLEKHGFDGIDLDWEHTKNAEEGAAYGDLIVDLVQVLKPKKRIVTAAIAAWQTMSPKAVAGLDRVNLMSYDNDGRHSTMEQARNDVTLLRKMGFPPSKIVLGLPLYGRSLKNRNDAKPYSEILATFKPKPTDDEAGDYYYNGPSMVEAKAELVKQEKLGGLMVWEVTQDAPGSDSLLAKMHHALGLPRR